MEWFVKRKKLLSFLENGNENNIHKYIDFEKDCERYECVFKEECVLCSHCQEILNYFRETEVEFTEDEMETYCALPSYPKYDHLVTTEGNALMRKNRVNIAPKYHRIDNPLLNYALVSTVFEHHLKRIVNFLGIYVCNNCTVVIKHPQSSTLVKETDVDPDRIVNSLVKMLYKLKEHQFCHGYPDINSLMCVNGILTIDPLSISSIDYQGKRIFYSVARTRPFSSSLVPGSTCSNMECSPAENAKINDRYFKISRDLLLLHRNFGFPLYASAVDTYFFLCSLRTCEYYRKFLEDDEVYSEVWKGMWKDDEGSSVNRELLLLEEQDKHSFDDLLPILEKYHLRKDIVEYLYEKLIVE